MLTNTEIAEQLAKDKVIEDICTNLRVTSNYYNDLVEEIYLIVMEYDNEKLNALMEKKQMHFWLTRVIKNNWESNTSPFWKTYRKFTSKQDDNADLTKLSQKI